MAHEEFPDIQFATPDAVDEAFAYEHADIIHGALERITELRDSLPSRLLRPFKRDAVEEVEQKIRHTAIKAGRAFDDVEQVVGRNRQQGRVLTAFFDHSPDLYGINADQHQILSPKEMDYCSKARWAIFEAYDKPQSEQPHVTTFHLFDSLSGEPQPSGEGVLEVLSRSHLSKAEISGELSRNKAEHSPDEVSTQATVFPMLHIPGGSHASGWDYPDQDIDQDERSVTVRYRRRGLDVVVSVDIAIAAEESTPEQES
jgi:hypothetical protein